jgi:threonine synthase
VRVLDDITGAIGQTPLVRLPRLGAGLAADLVVKHEALNPSGSLKDRIALHMVDDALARGVLRAGMVIVEPTSGNTGMGSRRLRSCADSAASSSCRRARAPSAGRSSTRSVHGWC